MPAVTEQNDVFRLPLPATGETVCFDEGKPRERVVGLALRLRSGGARKWVYHYRWGGRSQRITIGDASAWSLEQARARARELRVMLDKNENPAHVRLAEKIKAAKRETVFSAVIADYLDYKRSTTRPRSFDETQRYLKQYFKSLYRMPIASIERADVASRLRAIAKTNGAVSADRARAALSAAFSWMIAQGLAQANPVEGTIGLSANPPRKRVLTGDELAKLWQSLPDDDYGAIVRLLALTGCRRDEIGSLAWGEVDWNARTITIPGSRTKNHNDNVLPLSDMA